MNKPSIFETRKRQLEQQRTIDEDNIHMVQASYDIEYNKTKILQSILKYFFQ